MGSKYQRVEGVGDAVLFRGDPRVTKTDMDSWFTSLLENRRPEIAQRPYLYGSDAGFCPRRNCLLEHNTWVDAKVNSAGSGYMGIGVAFENLLAESLRRGGRLILQDKRLIELPEVKVSGKMDLIIWDREEDVAPAPQIAIVECKTCGDLPAEPKPSHLAQLLTYSAISGISKAYLLYMSRNLNPKQPIPIRVFTVDTSEEVVVGVLINIFLSRLSTDQHVLLPVPSHFRKHTECHYCEFRDYYCYLPREGLKDTGNSDDNSGISMNVQNLGLTPITPSSYIELYSLAKSYALELYKSKDDRYNLTLLDIYKDDRVLDKDKEGIRSLKGLKIGDR